MTLSKAYFKSLYFWKELTSSVGNSYLVYTGPEGFTSKEGAILTWQQIDSIPL